VIRLTTEIAGPDGEQRELGEARLLRMAEELRPVIERVLRDMEWAVREHWRKAFS
jgi:hypothetical protein